MSSSSAEAFSRTTGLASGFLLQQAPAPAGRFSPPAGSGCRLRPPDPSPAYTYHSFAVAVEHGLGCYHAPQAAAFVVGVLVLARTLAARRGALRADHPVSPVIRILDFRAYGIRRRAQQARGGVDVHGRRVAPGVGLLHGVVAILQGHGPKRNLVRVRVDEVAALVVLRRCADDVGLLFVPVCSVSVCRTCRG